MLENHVFAFCFYQCFQTQKESHGYFQEKKKKNEARVGTIPVVVKVEFQGFLYAMLSAFVKDGKFPWVLQETFISPISCVSGWL